MATFDIITPLEPASDAPAIRTIDIADLRHALASGVEDFWAMRTHVVFLCLIYPVIGIVLGRALHGTAMLPLLYPLATGFALIGPVAALGLYELSRRREQGLDTSWRHVFDVRHSPSLPGIVALSALLLAILAIWVFAANALYAATFGGDEPQTLSAFVRDVFTTRPGHVLFWAGNALGFVFAVVAASVSVISFPLMLDRHVGFSVAVITSIRAVLKNPAVMAVWGLIIAGALLLGSLPFFVGLAIALPVLGHATWHLYRRVIEPDAGHRPAFQPKARGRRSAADFPTALFMPTYPADDDR